MARQHRIPHSFSALVIALVSLYTTVVQAGGWQCGATSLQAASVQQCPASAALSCASIGATDYCCPTGTTCQWANAQVGCCAAGQSCSGPIANGAAVWQPTSSYYQQPTTYYQPSTSPCNCEQQPQPTTVYQQPTTVYVAGGGVQQVTTQVVPTQQTTVNYYAQQYCSTQTAQGPNLPTTAQGPCGTILIVAAAPGRMHLGFGSWVLVVGGVLGVVLL